MGPPPWACSLTPSHLTLSQNHSHHYQTTIQMKVLFLLCIVLYSAILAEGSGLFAYFFPPKKTTTLAVSSELEKAKELGVEPLKQINLESKEDSPFKSKTLDVAVVKNEALNENLEEPVATRNPDINKATEVDKTLQRRKSSSELMVEKEESKSPKVSFTKEPIVLETGSEIQLESQPQNIFSGNQVIIEEKNEKALQDQLPKKQQRKKAETSPDKKTKKIGKSLRKRSKKNKLTKKPEVPLSNLDIKIEHKTVPKSLEKVSLDELNKAGVTTTQETDFFQRGFSEEKSIPKKRVERRGSQSNINQKITDADLKAIKQTLQVQKQAVGDQKETKRNETAPESEIQPIIELTSETGPISKVPSTPPTPIIEPKPTPSQLPNPESTSETSALEIGLTPVVESKKKAVLETTTTSTSGSTPIPEAPVSVTTPGSTSTSGSTPIPETPVSVTTPGSTSTAGSTPASGSTPIPETPVSVTTPGSTPASVTTAETSPQEALKNKKEDKEEKKDTPITPPKISDPGEKTGKDSGKYGIVLGVVLIGAGSGLILAFSIYRSRLS